LRAYRACTYIHDLSVKLIVLIEIVQYFVFSLKEVIASLIRVGINS
jgi:hypothetical protein